MKRFWFWHTLRRGDILGAAFVLAVLGGFVFLVVKFPNGVRQATNAGFGPDWDCTSVGKGDPVCVKKIDAKK
jgi:hypothetical protein